MKKMLLLAVVATMAIGMSAKETTRGSEQVQKEQTVRQDGSTRTMELRGKDKQLFIKKADKTAKKETLTAVKVAQKKPMKVKAQK